MILKIYPDFEKFGVETICHSGFDSVHHITQQTSQVIKLFCQMELVLLQGYSLAITTTENLWDYLSETCSASQCIEPIVQTDLHRPEQDNSPSLADCE